MAFEEEFGIEIPDDAAEKIQTVGDAINFIDEQRQVLSRRRFLRETEGERCDESSSPAWAWSRRWVTASTPTGAG